MNPSFDDFHILRNFEFDCNIFMIMFNFMYMSILSKLLIIHIHPSSHVLSCIYICGLVMFWICMYTLDCTWHTYTLKKSSFDDFHVLRNIELYCLISWLCVSHYTCTLTLFDGFSWFCFHEYDMCLVDFECLVPCDLHVFHEKYFCFIPYLKYFVLV